MVYHLSIYSIHVDVYHGNEEGKKINMNQSPFQIAEFQLRGSSFPLQTNSGLKSFKKQKQNRKWGDNLHGACHNFRNDSQLDSHSGGNCAVHHFDTGHLFHISC